MTFYLMARKSASASIEKTILTYLLLFSLALTLKSRS
jgi:hypothetical protein